MLDTSTNIYKGISCSLELVTPKGKDRDILGATVRIGDNSLFLDAPIGVTPPPDVNMFIQRLLGSNQVGISEDRKLILEGVKYLQLGVSLARDGFRDNVDMILPDTIKGHNDVDVMRDEGNSEKQQWRLQMMSFASNVLKNTDVRGRVVLMPGSSDTEYRLWQSLGFDLKNMVFIEGDTRKYENLTHSPVAKSGVTIINKYLGDPTDRFSNAVLSGSAGENTSVLSLDTESNLTRNLYKDIVSYIDKVELGEDFILVLNIVAQRDNTEDIEALGKEKLGEAYNPGEYHPRSYVLGKMPEMLLGDIERSDLSLKHASTRGYIGFGDTRMECLFAHFKKK